MKTNSQNTEIDKIKNCLRCLRCKKQFSFISSNKIICQNSHEFSIDEGVLILETEIELPKKFRWGKKLRSPEENLRLDESQSTMAKEKAKKRMESMMDFVVENTIKENTTIVDIATGRGLFTRRLLPKLNNSIIFLSDLDPDILVGTRKLLLPLKGSNILIPIKASATHLPFEDNSLPEATSFGPNNVRETKAALIEIYRVLQPGGKFIFSLSLMEKGSPSHLWLKTQGDKPGPFDLIDQWQGKIGETGFKLLKKEILFDGPVEKVPLDLVPRENGERFQDVGIILVK